MPGGPEVLIIVAVLLLLLFGGKKIPEFGRSLGSAQREFREGLQEGGVGDAAPSGRSANTPATASAPTPVVGLEPGGD